MAEERLALTELLEKAGEGDFLRSVAEAVLQLLMDADVEGLVGAGRYERNGERTTWRNPEAASGQLLPTVPGSAQRLGEGADRGHPGGLDRRRVNAAGGRAGAGDGAFGHQQVAGFQAVPGHR